MTIKEILTSDKSLLNYCIEVNGELYDERKHGNLIHVATLFDTCEEYNHTFNITFFRSKVIFTAIEEEKIFLKLFEGKDKDADTSLSDYMDNRINEISKE